MYVAELHGMQKRSFSCVTLLWHCSHCGGPAPVKKRRRQQHRVQWFRIDIIASVQFKLASAEWLWIASKSVCLCCIRPAMTPKTAAMAGMGKIPFAFTNRRNLFISSFRYWFKRFDCIFFSSLPPSPACVVHIECTGIPVSFRKLPQLHVVFLQHIFA